MARGYCVAGLEMTLKIENVADSDEFEKERVVLRVQDDDDIGHYAVFQTRLSDDGRALSGKIAACYWFPDKEVKTGDLVVLYTKSGERSEKKNESGTTSHFFYWGMTEPLWTKKTPTLVTTPKWQVYKG